MNKRVQTCEGSDRYNVLHCFYLLLVCKQPIVKRVTYSSGGLAENTATEWPVRGAASLCMYRGPCCTHNGHEGPGMLVTYVGPNYQERRHTA